MDQFTYAHILRDTSPPDSSTRYSTTGTAANCHDIDIEGVAEWWALYSTLSSSYIYWLILFIHQLIDIILDTYIIIIILIVYYLYTAYCNITYHHVIKCILEEYSRLPTGRRIDSLPTLRSTSSLLLLLLDILLLLLLVVMILILREL